MARLFIMVVAGILFAPICASAAENRHCGERAKIVEIFKTKHKEVAQARGLATDTQLLEIFVSPQKSWTILLSFPDGSSCIMATGEAWDQFPVTLSGFGA